MTHNGMMLEVFQAHVDGHEAQYGPIEPGPFEELMRLAMMVEESHRREAAAYLLERMALSCGYRKGMDLMNEGLTI